LLNTLVSLCGCQIRTFCPKSGRWGKPELSLPIWIRILNETFWRPSGTKGSREILFTTPLRQTRKDPGNPDPTLGCRNGVVFKIDLEPFVTDEGRQKRARLKIRIQIGRESSGLPQRPDLGQNVRIWQPQRLTKVCIIENINVLIKQIYFQCLVDLSGPEGRRGPVGLVSSLWRALDRRTMEGCPSKGRRLCASEGSFLCKI